MRPGWRKSWEKKKEIRIKKFGPEPLVRRARRGRGRDFFFFEKGEGERMKRRPNLKLKSRREESKLGWFLGKWPTPVFGKSETTPDGYGYRKCCDLRLGSVTFGRPGGGKKDEK